MASVKVSESEHEAKESKDLEKALWAAISKLPNPLPRRIKEICEQLQIAVWQLVDGHLLKADQRAELHAPLLLPEWTDRTPSPAMDGEKICPACKKPFTPPEERPDAKFCCNFCGSGRYPLDQLHHEKCQFYIKPQQSVKLREGINPNLPPPEDPLERLKFEQAMLIKHLEEAKAAEAKPGGLTPIPSPEEGVTAKELWTKV